jgi:hypothetical protein
MKKASITLVTKPWTGWQRQQPEPTQEKIDLKKGDTLILEKTFGNYDMAVSDIGEDYIQIKPINRAPSLVNERGGINLKGGMGETKSVKAKVLNLPLRAWIVELLGH